MGSECKIKGIWRADCVKQLLACIAIFVTAFISAYPALALKNVCADFFFKEIKVSKAEKFLLENPEIVVWDKSAQEFYEVTVKEVLNGDKKEYVAMTEAGKRIARLEVYIDTEVKTMLVVELFVDGDYRNLGISKFLFANALSKNKFVDKISSTLTNDNMIPFEQHFAYSSDAIKSLQETFAYRVRRQLGFSKIVGFTYTGNAIHDFVVKRDDIIK